MQASSAILCGLHDRHCVPHKRNGTFTKTPEEEEGEEKEKFHVAESQEIASIHIRRDNSHNRTSRISCPLLYKGQIGKDP